MNTDMDVGMKLVAGILLAAKGADAIVTVCPMCQMNLEAYQKKICRLQNEDLRQTVLYLPQFIGLALGLPEEKLGIDLNLSIGDRFRQKLKQINESRDGSFSYVNAEMHAAKRMNHSATQKY